MEGVATSDKVGNSDSDSRLAARLRFLESRLQRQDNARARQAAEIQTLLAELELERAARHRLQQQVSEQAQLIERNSSAILTILTSRVWRTLTSIGGLALSIPFVGGKSTKIETIDPPPHRLESRSGTDDQVQEVQPYQGAVSPVTETAAPQRTSVDDWNEVLRRAAEALPVPSKLPLVTIVTPTYNSKPEWLAEAALSVFHQTFSNWEWCVVDDGSQRAESDSILSLLDCNPRVKVIRLNRRQGISGATNAGLQAASGEFMCVLDHDDLLVPDALKRCVDALQSGYDAVYTDEDKISDTGDHLQRFSKPEWSPEYFRNYMYVGHLLCVRRDLAIEIGGFDSSYDRVQDFEFFLRYSERTGRIAHLDEVLYHWRAVGGSIAQDQQAKGDLAPLQVAAVQAHLDRMGLPAEAQQGPITHVTRIVPRERASNPKVSIIISTQGAPPVLSSCLAGLRDRTTYPNLEVVCVHSGSKDTHAMDLIGAYRAACISSDVVLMRSDAYTIGSGRSTGQYLVLMIASVEPLTARWVEEMLYYAEQDDVGAVGGLILTPGQIVQQAGIAVASTNLAEPMWTGHDSESDGCFASLKTAHEVTALTSTCLMIRKELFDRSGGFNADSLRSGHDIDLCLRLIGLGKRNIFTPHARFLNHAGDGENPLVSAADRDVLARTRSAIIGASDRYYRPHDFGKTGDSLRPPRI